MICKYILRKGSPLATMMKYLEINLMKAVKYLYNENYKKLIKEIKEDKTK
jgi:hypothetical protein